MPKRKKLMRRNWLTVRKKGKVPSRNQKVVRQKHLTQDVNDKLEIDPALENLSSLPRKIGKVDTLLADAGYFSENNIVSCSESSIIP